MSLVFSDHFYIGSENMESMMEMIAFEEQINLPLLNDIIVFVADTAKADYTQEQALRKRCMLLSYNAKSSEFQQKYGFLYLGELLERYESRFGMSIQDRRAIALALGYTRHIVTNEMFVGNQFDAFLRELNRNADGDIYLTGALYLLNEGQRGETEWLERLYTLGQEKTEELIFTMSILPDFEQAFLRNKGRLIHLLGLGRTMALQDNMQIVSWLIGNLRPAIKAMRGNDLALLRALCALPVSFVKEESRHHSVLLEHGYTPFEIAYANIMAVRCRAVPDALSANSIVTEKIVVDLFQRALTQKESFSPTVYTLLSKLFTQYREFPIRCYGHSELLKALDLDVAIQNADTFIWCSNHVPLSNPLFSAFDILDDNWVSLSSGLPGKKYLELFERGLSHSMDKSEIQRHIARYDAVTGGNYLAMYRQESNCRKFSLLVETGVFDLWTEFQASIDEAGTICLPEMIDHIRSYIHGLKTVQAFQFFVKFLQECGLDGYQRYFKLKQQNDGFLDGLIELDSSNSKVNLLNLERDYLTGNTQATMTLLYWLEEYLFRYRPSAYISFICKLLQNKTATDLIPQNTLRPLFDLVLSSAELASYAIASLKERYWTPEELQAEKAAEDAAAMEAEREKQLKQRQDVQNQYEKEVDGTLAALYSFLTKHRITSGERSFAEQIVCDNLPQLLAGRKFTLETSESNQLLQICTELIGRKKMNFTEAQTYISQIKEVATYDTGNSTDK